MKKSIALALCLFLTFVPLLASAQSLDLRSAAGAADQEISRAYEGETVTIYTRFTNYPGWAKLVDAVKEKTGITINAITASTEYSDYVTKISAALTVGDSSYDIIDVDELLGVTFIASGFLQPITDVVEPAYASFLPSWMEGISRGEDGEYYMIPSALSAIYLYVNKALFEEKGIAYPTDLDAFNQAAIALTDPEKGVYGLGSAWMQGGYMFNDIQRLILAFNGDFYDWDNAGTRKAIRFMYDQLHTYGYTPEAAISDDYTQANQKFADGQYAMLFMWQNAYDTVKSKWEQYEIIPIPTFESAKTIINSWGFGLNAYSKNKDAAKEVLKAITTFDAMKCTLEMEGCPHVGVLNTEEALSVPFVAALAEYNAAGVLYPREMPVAVNEIQDAMETNVSAYVSGQISLDECCRNVDFALEDLI